MASQSDKPAPSITIYTKVTCPFCRRAKDLLNDYNVNFNEIQIDNDETLRQQMIQKANDHKVPQIFIDDYHVGGCDELYALESQGKLQTLLKQ